MKTGDLIFILLITSAAVFSFILTRRSDNESVVRGGEAWSETWSAELTELDRRDYKGAFALSLTDGPAIDIKGSPLVFFGHDSENRCDYVEVGVIDSTDDSKSTCLIAGADAFIEPLIPGDKPHIAKYTNETGKSVYVIYAPKVKSSVLNAARLCSYAKSHKKPEWL